MLAPIAAAARPVIVEGAKLGLTTLVQVGVVYGAVAAIGATTYGAYKGGQYAYNRVTGLFRKKEQPEQASADEAKATVTQAEAEIAELFRKKEQPAQAAA